VLTVYCPPLVPRARGTRLEYAGGLGGSKNLAPGYQISFGSRIVGGASGWGGHWTFAVGRPSVVARYLPTPASTNDRIRIRDRNVLAYLIPEGTRSFYAGHLVFAWRERGVAFHLTVHGYEWDSRLRRMTSAWMASLDRCRADPSLAICLTVVTRSRG
jgi:hypothetical protein